MDKKILFTITIFFIFILCLIFYNQQAGIEIKNTGSDFEQISDEERIIGNWERLGTENRLSFYYSPDGFVYPNFFSEFYWKYWFEDGYLYEHTYFIESNEPAEWGRQRFEYKFIGEDTLELRGGFIGSPVSTLLFVRLK